MLVLGLVIAAAGFLLSLPRRPRPYTLDVTFGAVGWTIVFVFGLIALLAARGVQVHL